MLTEEQRRGLVAIARQAVAAQVEGTPMPSSDVPDLPGASGVFVTVKHLGALRGCLGTLDTVHDLGTAVVHCAMDAACRDPRFAPVRPGELPGLSVEVSVLGPLEPIDPASPTAISIGRHGLVVEQGRRRGLLLPQVATERHWTAEEFLRNTCVKARLEPDAWQRGAAVFRFDAEVFGE